MKIDWYTKLVLTVIAIALGLIALRPLLVPTPSYAARSIEYKRIPALVEPAQLDQALNGLGRQGWDFAGYLVNSGDIVMKR